LAVLRDESSGKIMATETQTLNPVETDLRDLATSVVSRAMKSGATAAEAVVREGSEFSTVVRMGEVETLKESGSRAIGLRTFLGQRAASTYSSDFSKDGIDRLISGALELARVTSEDIFSGIPEPDQLGSLQGDLKLYYDDVYSLPPDERIDYARRAERAALEADPRMKNSDGGSFDAATGHKVLANSHGFVGEFRRSYCSVSAAPIAQDENGNMQRDYWFALARTMSKLESAESVGREAARRTLRRLGSRKIASTQVPIVLDPMVAGSILDNIFEALGNQHRREIIYALGLQPHSISSLAAMRDLSLPAIHKHIKILENADLIINKKSGRIHFLTLNRQAIQGIQEWLIQYQAYWGNNEETLENYAHYLNEEKK